MRPLFFLCVLVLAQAALPVDAQSALDRTLPRSGAKVLQLEAGAAEVTLTPTTGADSIHVRIEQDPAMTVPQFQSSHTANRLALSIVPPAGAPIVPFAQGTPVKYDVTYPADMRLDLRISSGNVHIVKPSSATEIYSQSGDILVDDPRGAVTAENGHGNITVTNALAPIDLAADDGNIDADLANGWSGNEIRLQAASGAIHLSVPAGFRARFDASSENGAVHNAVASSNVNSPFVWLYALKGDISVTVAKP